MIATAWRGLGWFLTGVAMALGLLLVPLKVAAERKKLDQAIADIREARRDIRALDTEFGTRANMAQLERWNGDTLKLTAPTAAQFVRDEAALASMDLRTPEGGEMQTAALVMPAAPAAVQAPAQATPAVAVAGAAPAKAAAVAVAAPAPASRVAAARPAVAVAVASARPRMQTVALVDRKLLSDHTFGDILSGARAEASSYR